MAKNIISDVARLLGVEVEEEFKIDGLPSIYKFTKYGLFRQKENLANYWDMALATCDGQLVGVLDLLISGKRKIVKLPWKPKDGETYYVAYFDNDNKNSVELCSWHSTTLDYALLKSGVIYRTREECEAHLKDDYRKLTGKEWKE